MIKIDMDYWYDCIEFIDSIHIDYIQWLLLGIVCQRFQQRQGSE